ncbi:hypothetical protein [uncultured Actinomyces sp.]|uniref:hypothetical protein n=1 Tax=uncultured Actinomyces sp. TaxID=249061 RepID=UPI00288BC14A|nr:hypothetical protein [uncultured Actinomyces sp.]
MPTVIHSLWIRGPVPDHGPDGANQGPDGADQGPDGADQGPDGGFGSATTTGAATAPARPT